MKVLIINYNTQNLTEACIKSLNKHTPNLDIYIFDNSDNGKFINNFSNVTVIDNTEGQIIDFDSWLEKFPEHDKSPIGSGNNYASSKHCVSVQKGLEIINDNVVLMDSDVLIKKDISDLYDDECIYVGSYEKNEWHDKRLMPFICFINYNMCKQYGIKYFDENRIVGLTIEGEKYDTGCSFYVDSNQYKHKVINIFDYITHFAQGSWNRKNHGEETWIKRNRALWDEINNDLDIFINTHKDFTKIVKSDTYKVVNAKEINPNLPLTDKFYSELYQFKYISDNIELKKYVGFCHYRRYFNFLDNIPDMDEMFKEYDLITSEPFVYKITNKEFYKKFHNIEDLYVVGGIIADKYPNYCKMWQKFLNSKIFIPYNMFIMKSEDFKEYVNFIFDVLGEYLNIVGLDINKRVENNKDRYLKDFYPNNTIEYQYRIGGYIAERLTNLFILTKYRKVKTYPVVVTENKYSIKKEQSTK